MAPAGYGHSVEGHHAVAAAARAGRIEVLWVEAKRAESTGVADLLGAVEEGGGTIEKVDDVRRQAETSAPQGMVARCRPILPVDLETVARVVSPPAVVVLDRIVDPHNVGAIVRSGVAAGVGAFVLSDRRAAPLSALAFKAAAGALEEARVSVVGSVAEAVAQLSRLGLWTVGLAATGGRQLFGLDLLAEPVAVVVGAEGEGLSRLVAERVDVLTSISLPGPAESLNASVAAALATFEIARQRGFL